MGDSATLAASHILESLKKHRQDHLDNISYPPLFVAIQGPQGSGKTHLTRALQSILTSPPHSLHLAVFSLDDLYLTHDGLLELSNKNPQNLLWKGRGQPGTHDIALGIDLLQRLSFVNTGLDRGPTKVELPVFDKSLFGGEGDRLPTSHPSNSKIITPPRLDVVALEGWCMGFQALHHEDLEERIKAFNRNEGHLNSEGLFNSKMIRNDDIVAVNDTLALYSPLWDWFKCFIQMQPPHPFNQVYTWRLQAEHAMKAQNGGRGMTDDQVKEFIDRYVPGYLFFLDSIERGSPMEANGVRGYKDPSWKGNGLRICIGDNREVLSTSAF